jgi:C4-dicarboxylate-specific signal transduction histidine kinase
MEYRLRRADGEYRWVLDNGVPRYTPQGAFAGYIGSCVDITERKRSEEQRCQAELEVRRLQHELFHVTRVSLMGALTSALAHELNQPLTDLKLVVQTGTARFLGCLAIGPRAAEIVNLASTAIRLGLTARQLTDLSLVHPSASEALVRVLQARYDRAHQPETNLQGNR